MEKHHLPAVVARVVDDGDVETRPRRPTAVTHRPWFVFFIYYIYYFCFTTRIYRLFFSNCYRRRFSFRALSCKHALFFFFVGTFFVRELFAKLLVRHGLRHCRHSGRLQHVPGIALETACGVSEKSHR
jgi:hypothetical protein